MRPSLTFFSLIALAVCGCDNAESKKVPPQPISESTPPPKPFPEQRAIDKFKAELQEVNTWRAKRAAELKDDPILKPMLAIELIPKLRAIDSTDLPVDLKIAWRQLMAKVGKADELMKGMGAPDLGRMIDKSFSSPYAAQEYKSRLNVVMAEIAAAGSQFTPLAKKYGIDFVNPVVPQ